MPVPSDQGEVLSPPGPIALTSNRAIENAAVQWVISWERTKGRKAVDFRRRLAPYDIESLPRRIEVKAFGTSNRGFALWLEAAQVAAARSDPAFWLYVVENVAQGDPSKFRLKTITGPRLSDLLDKARLKTYYEVPWPVADYDSAPDEAILT